MNSRVSILILFFVLLGEVVHSQYYDKQNGWKTYKHELIGGFGFCNYLGELGGGSGDGRVWLMDLEMSQFKPSFNLGYRYNLSYRTSARLHFLKGKISGSDQLTENETRRYRNLSFQTDIYEFTALFEYWILRSRPGHVYHIKGAKGERGMPFEISAFAGVGAFYFNPKSDGIPLRPLSTEGQGLPGGPPIYSPISVAFPFGMAGNIAITNRFKLGMEASFRYTLTDYLDDASGVYFDNDQIRAAKGEVAAAMADRTDGSNPGWSAVDAPRGNPKQNDFYLSFMINATYNITRLTPKVSRPGGRHSFLKSGRKARF
ncbi:MAG: hypothetical protein KDC83_03765 [Flavobacteriales bacterium]|nr:hypothetical protein [Flavobacteriales bacterium]